MNALAWVVGVVFVVLGVLAYSGRWKGWIRTARGFGTFMGFAWLYLGLALLVAGMAITLPAPAWLVAVLLGVAAMLLLVAIVGFWWLPSFLQPAWFRRLRADAIARGGTR